ncbi:hypothetical protein A3Q37_05336 [Streptomyces sp. PTY087I2]|nr:hypothetical protein A3Q37_05336 [Streptomyces sp. PTY087I2]
MTGPARPEPSAVSPVAAGPAHLPHPHHIRIRIEESQP